jgi:PAS domain S-box-containing protein
VSRPAGAEPSTEGGRQLLFALLMFAQVPDPISGGAGWVGAGLLGLVLGWLLLVHLPSKDKQLDAVYAAKAEDTKDIAEKHEAAVRLLVDKHEAAIKKVVEHCDREIGAEREASERRHKDQMAEFGRLHEDNRDQVHAFRGLLQLISNRTRLADALQSQDMATWTKSLDGVMLSWNDAAEELLGWPSVEVVGKSVYATVIPPERKDEELSVLRRIAAGERVGEYQTERLHKDGRRVRDAWRSTSHRG